MRRLTAVALVAVLAACGGDDDEAATTTTTTAGDTTTTTADAGAPEPAGPDLDAVEVVLTEVARLDQPLAMAVLPGGGLLVAEKGGGVVRVDDGEEVLDISGDVSGGNEQGLLGIAVHPDGGRLFLSYTNRAGDSEIHEWAIDDAGEVDEASRRAVIDPIEQPAANHNGGGIAFGPDGLLWYGLGDGGAGGDRFRNGQDADTLLGSMVVVDPDVPGGRPRNPMIGLRNPWRWSFDEETGDLWIADVGQGAVEEVDRVPAGSIDGANGGWPIFEGDEPYDGGDEPSGYVPPVHTYGRDEGISVVGGYVYRGEAIPALRGAYLFADTYSGFVRAIVVEGGEVTQERELFREGDATIASFGQDADGELYVLGLSGRVWRIDAA